MFESNEKSDAVQENFPPQLNIETVSEELRNAFAFVEDGFEPIPASVEVDDINQILEATSLSPDALEGFRSRP